MEKQLQFIANCLLAEALKEGYPIAPGTALATPPSLNALMKTQELYGYKTTIYHITTPDRIRNLLEKRRREKGMIQCTPTDFVEKQVPFVKLLLEYVKLPHISFYVMKDNKEPAEDATKFPLIKVAEKEGEKITVTDVVHIKTLCDILDDYKKEPGYAENTLFGKIL